MKLLESDKFGLMSENCIQPNIIITISNSTRLMEFNVLFIPKGDFYIKYPLLIWYMTMECVQLPLIKTNLICAVLKKNNSDVRSLAFLLFLAIPANVSSFYW